MRIDVLGCRGSVTVDGAEFSRYGGATSAVAVGNGATPSLLLDAGTGLRHLADITNEPFTGSILLSHLHWDHVQGLPFSPLLDQPESRIDLYVPIQGESAESLFHRFMSPPAFPITAAELRGRVRFREIEPGRQEVEGFEVTAFEVPHKGGRTFGYRVANESYSLGYVPDHAPGKPGSGRHGLGVVAPSVAGAIEGSDLLFHDAQHLDHEFAERAFLGHSAIGYALEMGAATAVGKLLLFHHDPSRTDQELDALAETLPEGVVLTRQGMRL